MRRAEIQARIAAGGLVVLGILLLTAAGMYGSTVFWAAGLAALAQALLAALAMWGLKLAREQEEVGESGIALEKFAEKGPSLGGFAMSYGDDEPVSVKESKRGGRGGGGKEAPEVRTLETGFQRVVVAMSAVGLLILAGVIAYLIRSDFAATDVGEVVSAARRGAALDPLAVVLAVGCLLGYIALVYATRVKRETQGYAEAVSGTLTTGLPGMLGMAAAIVAAWLGMAYVVQLAAALIAVLLLVQALELLVNAMRSYAGIEEFDQAPVNLQRLPLTLMLTSAWVIGLKGLLAQSVGVARQSEDGQPGLFARMMPRVLIAMAVLAVLSSMVRVVRPGEVAIRERLGQATKEDIDHPLNAGFHLTAPWPIDELVRIPTEHVQEVTVGTEEPVQVSPTGVRMDFRFWTFKHTQEGVDEQNFVTGDMGEKGAPSPELLGTFVSIWWRVTDPSAFYTHLSHSDFIEQSATSEKKSVVRPIYEAMIQQIASRAVTQTFAQHSMEEIMGSQQGHVEQVCRAMLQQELDHLNSGIGILGLTIKDVHPPIGIGRRQTATGQALGPADAYEDVVSAREERETRIDLANADATQQTMQAQADIERIMAEARTSASQRVNAALGSSERRAAMAAQFGATQDVAEYWLLSQMLQETLSPVRKIIVGPGLPSPEVIQPNLRGDQLVIPPGPPPG